MRLRVEDPQRSLAEAGHVPVIQRKARRECLEDRDRAAQLGVDRRGNGPGEFDSYALGLNALLMGQGIEPDARHDREGNDTRSGEQQQPSAKRDILASSHGSRRVERARGRTR